MWAHPYRTAISTDLLQSWDESQAEIGMAMELPKLMVTGVGNRSGWSRLQHQQAHPGIGYGASWAATSTSKHRGQDKGSQLRRIRI